MKTNRFTFIMLTLQNQSVNVFYTLPSLFFLIRLSEIKIVTFSVPY